MDDDARFDRLVDGALTAPEYKAFVAALEDEPGGWRRCALAFLEAQAWGKEFAAIRRVDQDRVRPAAPPVETKVISRGGTVFSAGSLLCAALSFVLAFGLGLFSYGKLFPPSSAAPHMAAKPSEKVNAAGALDRNSAAARAGAVDRMHLVIDRGEGLPPEEIVVPVVEAGMAARESLVLAEPAIPDSVLRSLRLRGHKISRQHEYIPIALDDGRQVILPVEQYQITPVSSKSY